MSLEGAAHRGQAWMRTNPWMQVENAQNGHTRVHTKMGRHKMQTWMQIYTAQHSCMHKKLHKETIMQKCYNKAKMKIERRESKKTFTLKFTSPPSLAEVLIIGM